MVQSVSRDDKPCSGCGEEPRRPGQRYCAQCHADAQAAYRHRRKTERLHLYATITKMGRLIAKHTDIAPRPPDV